MCRHLSVPERTMFTQVLRGRLWFSSCRTDGAGCLATAPRVDVKLSITSVPTRSQFDLRRPRARANRAPGVDEPSPWMRGDGGGEFAD